MQSAAPPQKTQVVIVGGGLTGLALALMLSRLNLSFVLLEAYPELAKPVGTALVLLAHGLRIFDQLGLLDDIAAVGQPVLRQEVVDGRTGSLLFKLSLPGLMRARHGYDTLVMARHEVLRVLATRLETELRAKEESKEGGGSSSSVLTGKRVARIENFEDRAVVRCEDGSSYEAQIVVGADGIHSTVRREMWREADEKALQEPKEHRSAMRCEYALVFAQAPPMDRFAPGDVLSMQRHSSNAGVMCGRNGELFLFYYWRLPSSAATLTSPDAIPRISAEEQKARWAEAAAIPVDALSGLKFRDLMAGGLERGGGTALPHHVFEQWHRGRVIMLGDAVHKFNPLMGQGGNSCIESAAALANHLSAALASSSSPAAGSPCASLQDPQWPIAAVTKAFEAVQAQRQPRVSQLIKKSQVAQYMVAWDGRFYECIARFIMPRLSRKLHADIFSSYVVGGLKLEGKGWRRLERTHAIPWDDERPEGLLAGVVKAAVALIRRLFSTFSGKRVV